MLDTIIPLSEFTGADLGTLAISGYDTCTFGFPVGSVTLNWDVLAPNPAALDLALTAATKATGVALVACTIGGADYRASALLQRAQFRFIEARLQMRAVGSRHKDWKDPGLRDWVTADRDRLLNIAERIYVDGRYTADPRFPDVLANRRNRILLEQALDGRGDPTIEVHVVGPEGAPNAFLYLRRNGTKVDYQLGGADTEEGNGVAAMRLFAIYAGVATRLRSQGVREIRAQIAASNAAVGQTYQRIGFTLDAAQLMYHWADPTSPHLIAGH